jgi:Na+/proline symporter
MSDVEISDERAKGIRRLLYVVLAFSVVLLLLSLPLILGDYVQYGVIVLAIALVLGILGGLAHQAVGGRTGPARRLCLLTGVATIVLSVPLIPIWIGLLTAITGVGLLVVVLAPEREAS